MQDRATAGDETAKPYALHRDEGIAIWIVDALDTIKARSDQTGGRFALIEAIERAGSGPPLHVHADEDEGYYVLEGQYSFFIGDDAYIAPTGTWVYAPRGIPHTFRCDSATGRILMLIVPGGWESFFTEAGEQARERTLPPASDAPPDIALLAERASAYGVTILGPPP